jgi:hypothetical protein
MRQLDTATEAAAYAAASLAAQQQLPMHSPGAAVASVALLNEAVKTSMCPRGDQFRPVTSKETRARCVCVRRGAGADALLWPVFFSLSLCAYGYPVCVVCCRVSALCACCVPITRVHCGLVGLSTCGCVASWHALVRPSTVVGVHLAVVCR